MKFALRIVAIAVALTSLACASTSSSSGEQPAADKQEAPDYSGTYKNSGGGTLTVSNYEAGKGFDFKLVIASSDACDTVNYSDKATLSDAKNAKSGSGGTFVLSGDAIKFEPSTEQIGMDCARLIDTAFKK